MFDSVKSITPSSQIIGPMITKIFKGVWFFSFLGTVALFLYTYASLPPELVDIGNGEKPLLVSRNSIFYFTLILLALFNASVLFFTRLRPEGKYHFHTWLYGLVICINLFISVSLQFVSLINSQERFNYESIGTIIYGSLLLIVLWTIWYPLYSLAGRFFGKQVV